MNMVWDKLVSRQPRDTIDWLTLLGPCGGLIAIGLCIYLAYRFAESIARLLGATGLEVLVRLSAFILMCIGIEIIWNGYSTLHAAAG